MMCKETEILDLWGDIGFLDLEFPLNLLLKN